MVPLFVSNTYSKIEKASDLLWRFQRHRVVTQFVYKPEIPHPFAWISLLLRLLDIGDDKEALGMD